MWITPLLLRRRDWSALATKASCQAWRGLADPRIDLTRVGDLALAFDTALREVRASASFA
jgi:hypothetical protein